MTRMTYRTFRWLRNCHPKKPLVLPGKQDFVSLFYPPTRWYHFNPTKCRWKNWPPEIFAESTPSDRWFTGCNKANWSATTSPISANVKYLQPLTAEKTKATGNINWQSCGLDMIGLDDVFVACSGKLLFGWDCMLKLRVNLLSVISGFCSQLL